MRREKDIKLLENLPLFVLAGGRATRLGSLSDQIPKYLMPVKNNKTFADVHLEWARAQGFKKVILSVGYLGDLIQSHCGDGSKWNLKIKYVKDGPVPLGTGGAVKKSLIFDFEDLAVTYGDTLLNFNVKECFEEYLKFKNKIYLNEKDRSYGNETAFGDITPKVTLCALMTYYKNTISGHRCNVGVLEDNLIVYNKTQPDQKWKHIDYGFSIFNRKFIESLEDKIPLDLADSIMKLSEKKLLMGFECQNEFKEIGSPEALANFSKKME